MSRHRHFRGGYDPDDDFGDEYDDEDYGNMDEHEGCLSPTEARFVFRRERTESGSEVGPSMGQVSGLYEPTTPRVPEENEELMDEAFADLSVQAHPGTNAPEPLARPPSIELSQPPKPRSPQPPLVAPSPKVIAVKAEAAGFNLTPERGSGSSSARSSRQASPARSTTPSSSRPKYTGRNSFPTPRAPRVLLKEPGARDHLNLVVIGHVDAGKSTLLGHLLVRLGHIGDRQMHKHRTEATKAGKGSFAFAWVLDESREERERGVTMDIARSAFTTPTKHVTLLDAPGHRDFIPNMITGATQADAAVLVVNAAKGEFETGFQSGGQTREHAMLARSLGVSSLIVAVNKLDAVEWSEERYNEVRETMRTFLRTAGYPKAVFVPLSGLAGVNLSEGPEPGHPLSAWYKGPCLMQLIDELPASVRDTDKEVRITVSDVYKGLTGGLTVTAKVETGSVESGDRLLAQPAGEWLNVRSVEGEGLIDGVAWAGNEVSLSLTSNSQTEVSQSLGPGSVLVSADCPLVPGARLRVDILTFPDAPLLLPGSPAVLHAHNLQENVTVSKLVSLLSKSGEETKKRPRSLAKGSRAIVELRSERSLALEPASSCRQLGRVSLRAGGKTVAAGVLLQVIQ